MIAPRNLKKGLLSIVLSAALAMLAGCVTSDDLPLNAKATPAKTGKYQVQYHVDGKWTKFASGSLARVNGTYTWTGDRESLSLLNAWPPGFRFTLVDIGNNYFIVVVASADLRNPTWAGNHVYGIARRVGDSFQYDFPSCLDLLVSQGFSDRQIAKIKSYACFYSSKASLTAALTRYANRTAMWKRLAPVDR